jgi:spore coat polysaccharide biosynthesis protein SpsF
MNSSRLPGKVMLDVEGKPILLHIYSRLKKSNLLDSVVISTGGSDKNQKIIDFARTNMIPLFSGSEDDLVDRLYKTAIHFQSDAIVRITADCPLADPQIIDELVNEYIKNNEKYDIVTNCIERTFPHGLDVEVYSTNVLKKLLMEIPNPKLREWFSLYVQKNQKKFKILNKKNKHNLSELRWTLDYLEDYEFIKQVYAILYKKNSVFLMNDVLDLLKKQPKLLEINSKYAGIHNVGSPTISFV